MAFENSFTGKNTGIVLPSGEGAQRAQENASNLILSAAKTKQEAYQKNQEEFLKSANIDPVFVLASSARDAQAKMLEQFNTKYGKLMKERGGNLTTDDKMQMAKDKDFILMNQQKMQSDMAQALAAKDAIQKDVQGNLDHKDFQKRWDNFVSKGEWDSTPLVPSAIDPDAYFSKDINKGNFGDTTVSITKKNPDGTITTVKKKASGTEQQGRDLVAAHLHSNDRLARGWIEKFQLLKTTNPEEYKKYLDGGDNPILRWAQDNYWDKAIKTGEEIVDKPQSTGSRTTFDWNVGIGEGHNQNNRFNIQRDFPQATSEGKFEFPDYMNLGQVSQTSETQNIPEIIVKDENGHETTKALNETAAFHLVGYSPTKDQLIIELDNKSSDYSYSKGDVLVVPASRFDDLLKKKPFGVYRSQTPKVTTTEVKKPRPY